MIMRGNTKTKLDLTKLFYSQGFHNSSSVECKGRALLLACQVKSTNRNNLTMNRVTLTSFIQKSLKSLSITVTDRDISFVKDNTSTVYDPNLIFLYNE